MGCVSSKPPQKRSEEEEENDENDSGMLATNSMVFTKDAMAALKKSKSSDARDPEILMSSGVFCKRNVLSRSSTEVIYPPELDASETIVLTGEDEVVLNFGYHSLQGRPAHEHMAKPNQDSLAIFPMHGKSHQAIFGIFDGHGPFGEFASHYIRENLHTALADTHELNDGSATFPEIINRSISRIHREFIALDPGENNGVDPDVSGAVIVIAAFDGRTLHVANVGDARCVYGYKEKKSSKARVIPMSEDHKPENMKEQRRLRSAGAVLLTEGELRGGSRKQGKTYVCRKNKQNQVVYGVMFSRSIGDLDAHNCLGVSADAEIKTLKLHDQVESQCLVLASDGVWDQLSNDEAVELALKHNDPLSASKAIMELAKDRWDNSKSRLRRDDISVIVIRILL